MSGYRGRYKSDISMRYKSGNSLLRYCKEDNGVSYKGDNSVRFKLDISVTSRDLLEALHGDVLRRIAGADQQQLLALELVSVSKEGRGGEQGSGREREIYEELHLKSCECRTLPGNLSTPGKVGTWGTE